MYLSQVRINIWLNSVVFNVCSKIWYEPWKLFMIDWLIDWLMFNANLSSISAIQWHCSCCCGWLHCRPSQCIYLVTVFIARLLFSIPDLWKESLNRNGQQYHQVQQSEQWLLGDPWLLTIAHRTQKRRPRHMMLEIPVAWDRHKNVTRLNCLMGSQPSPLDNWISNGNTDTNKWYKNLHRFASIKKNHTITKKNDNVNMDSTIARSVNVHKLSTS